MRLVTRFLESSRVPTSESASDNVEAPLGGYLCLPFASHKADTTSQLHQHRLEHPSRISLRLLLPQEQPVSFVVPWRRDRCLIFVRL